LLPAARLLPFTVSVAVTVPPEPASAAVPNAVPPAEKLTLPVGAVLPLAAVTVTVKTVDALWAILTGLAANKAVVAIRGAATVTVIAAETELAKLPLPA
jgi:hypothetical protein